MSRVQTRRSRFFKAGIALGHELRLDETTACGGCCTSCTKKLDGICKGCIEADGYVPEWAESGRCRVHACTSMA